METPIVIDFNFKKTLLLRKWSLFIFSVIILIILLSNNKTTDSIFTLILLPSSVFLLATLFRKSKGHNYVLLNNKIIITYFVKGELKSKKEIPMENIKVVNYEQLIKPRQTFPIHSFTLKREKRNSKEIKIFTKSGKLSDEIQLFFKSKGLLN